MLCRIIEKIPFDNPSLVIITSMYVLFCYLKITKACFLIMKDYYIILSRQGKFFLYSTFHVQHNSEGFTLKKCIKK